MKKYCWKYTEIQMAFSFFFFFKDADILVTCCSFCTSVSCTFVFCMAHVYNKYICMHIGLLITV